MLDNIFSSVKRGAEKVQRRGEEVAQSARLRLEVYQLSRELDSLYARLGRAYHAEADPAVLGDLREDVRRLDEEIAAREHLIAELGEAADEAETHREAVQAAAARTRPASETVLAVSPPVKLTKGDPLGSPAAEPNLGDLPDLGQDTGHPVPTSDAPTGSVMGNAPAFVEHQPRLSVVSAASRIWRAKEEERMSDDTTTVQTTTVQLGSQDQQASQQVDPVGPDDEAVMTDLGKELPPRKEDYSGVGDEAERDHMRRHPFTLKEGEEASRNPDPLDK
ncbi:hypothetical protein GCM10022631_31080 [Deinococcus rubellus]|uniref:Uncharacterized protein n=1 Tax=Deinococcus rubellus TaxID=1889240 RepID=A0ABY5YEF1_9DEIO|nr:hypothetical protein [Deinococcus rubellus]UWX63450.1 hypothetical protein N0D28_11940 [Deinococcus rubellus]